MRPEPAERSYSLHGVRLGVSGWPEGADLLHSRLACLPHGPGEDGDLSFEFLPPTADLAHLARPAAGRPVYDPPGGEVLYDDAADRLYLDLGGRLRAVCEAGRGRALLAAPAAGRGDLWLLSHPLFTLPLVELLKRRGLYHVHAAALCRGGRGLVLALTIALARAGFGFLGDDTLFLARRPAGLRLLAFPDEVDLTDETLRFFPELAPVLDAPRRDGWRKRPLRAEEVYGAPVVWECAPGHLVFPAVSGRAASELTPIGADEALLELAPNVLLTDPASSQAHLDALADLAAASCCWRLATGRDLDAAVRRLAGLFPPEAGR